MDAQIKLIPCREILFLDRISPTTTVAAGVMQGIEMLDLDSS